MSLRTRRASVRPDHQAADRRRLRRTSGARLICSTNGCATALAIDPSAGTASCPICGFHRRVGATVLAAGAA
ncbi:MAG: hypothetical protein ACKOTZ_04905 [Chloroflexota bacterium]